MLVCARMGRYVDGKFISSYIVIYTLLHDRNVVLLFNPVNQKQRGRGIDRNWKENVSQLGLRYSFYGRGCVKYMYNVFPTSDTCDSFKCGGTWFTISSADYENQVKGKVTDWVSKVRKFLPQFNFNENMMDDYEILPNSIPSVSPVRKA